MRIKLLEIGSFGKLKNYSLSLENGLQVLYGDNEDGKSTIMNFLYLMFYGNAKVKTINGIVNIRKNYAPWDGEKMYGAVIFEYENMEYRLEKVFNKSRATDIVTLWNNTTGEKENLDKGKEVGELIFGMSDSAFEKSVFIGCVGGIGSDDDISTKLSNMVTNGDESLSLKTTMKHILDAKYELISKSKKTGKLVELEEQINILKEEKNTAIAMEEKRHNLEVELDAALSWLQSLKDRKNRYELNSILLENRLEYNKINTLIKEIENLDESIKGMKIPNIDVELETSQIPITNLNNISLKKLKAYIGEMVSLKKEMDSARKLYEEKIGNQVKKSGMIISQENPGKTEEDSKKKGYLYLMFLLGIFCLLFGMFLHPLGYLGLPIVIGITIVLVVFNNDSKSKSETEYKEETYSKEHLEIKRRLYNLLQEKEEVFLEKVSFFCNTKDFQRGILEVERQENIYIQLEKQKNQIENKLEVFGWKNKTLKELVEEKNKLESKVFDEARNLIPVITKEELEKQKEKATDIHREIEEVEKKINELKFGQGGIHGGMIDINQLEEKEKRLTKLHNQMKEYYEILLIAQEIMEEASNELTSTFSPMVNAKTSQIFNHLTNGKYKSVSISKKFDIRVLEDGDIISRESEYLSNGTLDQVYLSLRLAIAELISKNQSRLPVFLDDVFMQYDDKRMKKGMKFLYEYAKNNQVLFFTCHENVVKWCRENHNDIMVKSIRSGEKLQESAY